MAKTKGYVVTTGEGWGEDCGAIFVPTLDEALALADDFAANSYAGYIMRVKGIYAYEPHETEFEQVVVATNIEAVPSNTMDDWSNLLG